ncbi:hypothetical protein JKP88DRAFT_261255 [Tribonema minus]|uniref:Right handed beta helix domain-containing protein n=1 Tax=Tribonema minus TaxID=303371 RepID=A0A835Z053_9STRA|nr:hypothetical protein JKP88DRAFT_261255 [Tribonema minus]
MSVTTLVLWALAALLVRAMAAPVAPACKAPPDIIDDHASAMKLTAAAACPRQNIAVKWRGFVGLTEPIIVAAGTSLDITGVGVDSEPTVISGRDETQLLRVQTGAVVTLRNLRLRNGHVLLVGDFGGGGAVRVLEGGELLLEACQFWYNRGGGGAIYSDGDFTCGNSTFTSNTARNFGGAIHNLGDFTCGDSTFASNSAANYGGAISNSGDFTCDNSTFSSNKAGAGGAIDNTGIFTCGNSTFSSNNAAGSGGAIYNEGDFTCGNSTFASNTADRGGAIYNSGDFTCGDSTFASNTAADFGGAIYNSDDFTCGDSTFASNTAAGGGAIYSDGDFTCGNSTFNSNKAGSGGAIFNVYDFTCNNSTFTSNTAVNGGAIFGDHDANVTCNNLTFASNTAEDGGAVYVAGDAHFLSSDFHDNTAAHYGGTMAVVEGAQVKCTESNFTRSKGGSGAGLYLAQDAAANIRDTTFAFNSATVTGGALYLEPTVTGNIDGCSFLNNTSPVGGALSLALADDTRNFTVSDCDFNGNIASVGAGGAIIQQGTATVLGMNVDNNTFGDNTAECCYAGMDSDGVGQCMDTSTGFGTGWSCCNDHQYLATDVSDEHICVTCDTQKLNCTSIGLTVGTLPVAVGFWRETFNQTEIRKCWNAGACTADENHLLIPTDIYCSEGYTGPYCAVCAPGYARLPGYRCVECNSGATAATITVLAIVALVILLLVWLLFSKSTGVGDGVDGAQTVGAASPGLKLARIGVLLMQRFRIPIVVLQVLTQYISITGLTLPLQYLEFLRAVDFMSLDMRWLTSPGCAADINFYGRLLIATLAPLAITALIFTPRFYLWIISRRRHAIVPKLRQVVTRDVNAFLVFTFLIFSGVSLTVFQTFGCDELQYSGKSYLRADYSLECGDDEGLHTRYSIYAAFMIVVYPVGIPVLYASILWRSAVKQRDRTQLPSRLASATSFLWRPYKGRAYFWEPVECLRRLMLAGLLVFIMPGKPGQSAVACLFAFLTGMVYEQIHPHQQGMDKWLYTLGYGILFTSMFTSLLMQGHWVEGGSEQAIGNLLITLNVLLLVMALVQVGIVYRGVRTAAGPHRQNSLFDRYRGSSRNAVGSTVAPIDDPSAPSPLS